MGAWENGNFGNDDAMDFVEQVKEHGKKEILKAVEKIVAVQYPDAPDCSIALAAIEYIAAAKGRPSGDLPEEAEEWLAKTNLLPFTQGGLFGIGAKKIDIILLSNQAIDKIKTSSELKELWEESDQYQDWLKIADDLKERISQ